MNQFYSSSAKTLLTLSLCTLFSASMLHAQTSPCGPIVENFNATNGTTAGFTSSTVNSTAAGFTYGQAAGNGYLQRCAVPSGGTVYQITTPTYQSFASQTAVGYGFDLSGIVLVSRVVVLLQFIADNGDVNTVEVANFVPTYNGVAGTGVASECRSVAFSTYEGFTPGEAYRFIFQFTSSSSSQAGQCIVFDNFRTTGTNSQISLPVTFTNVNVRRSGNGAQLIWNVAGERDVRSYEVERSVDGRNFVKIGEVSALNHDAYAFTDVQPLQGLSYYRVRNVDIDGRSKYSYVVRYNANRVSASLQLYPNPTNGDAVLEHNELGQNARFSIIDMNGRIVRTIVPLRGVTNTRINLSGLTTGTYVLRVENGNGYAETTSFVKY
jgi:hypothetical protein